MLPKVLFVVIDQIRADLLFGRLADHIELPNLRRLMDEAVSFTNHVSVANPCGPSRTSMLTGRYAMNHRSVRNGAPLAHDTPNLARELRKGGYHPLLFGYTDTTRDPRRHPPKDPLLATYETEMPGFEVVTEMRMEENRAWLAYLHSKGYRLPQSQEIWVPAGDRIAAPAFYRAEDSDTAFLTDCCLNALAVRRDQRWCAHLTYLRPHPPFVAPAPYNEMYDPAGLPLPHRPFSREEEAASHPYFGPLLEKDHARQTVIGFPDLGDDIDTVQQLRALYFGLATEVDHHLGRILDWLKHSGQWDDTLVIVCGDHGEMLGDRHCWGKRAPFAEAYHVPLIVRMPGGRQGLRVSAPTESVDLLPTILQAVGLEIPHFADGASLIPFLQGEEPEGWRDASYSELDFGNPVVPTLWQSKLGLSVEEANLAILREGAWTLVHFNGGLPPLLLSDTDRQAADHSKDPANSATLLRLTRRLLDHRMRHADRGLSDWMITPEGPKLRR
ncbi:MAG: sulfatase-like hydrolase/transferase [Rhodobacter sp.]|nr:sulfatase-like hydrolase/transferase [Rhodobacter sp.]